MQFCLVFFLHLRTKFFVLVFFRGLPAVEGASKGIFLVFEVPVYKTKATMPNFASKTFFYVINA